MIDAAFLKAYRTARQDMAVMERHLAQCGVTGRPAAVGAYHYDSMPHGTNHATAAAIQYQDGIEAAVQAMRRELADMEPRFQAIMSRARNFRDRSILRQYYQLGQTDAQVADFLCVSVRHANRLRSELLTYLDDTSTMSTPVVVCPSSPC